MNLLQYTKLFRHKALNAGYSEENIQRCLFYAEPLIKKKLPVIFNTSNLCALVGYDKTYLKKAVLFTNKFYRSFNIVKKNGKQRNIKEPLPSLKEIQLWILNNILYNIPISKYAKAYIKERNIVDNAKYHVAKEKILNLDIKDFFPSIKRKSIERVFLNEGYSSNISNLLSKLCCLDESLPQGAPTSPYLSNIFMYKFDLVIADFCKKKQIRFTRYADDLTFSGSFDEHDILKVVEEEIANLDLQINPTKTQILKQNVRQVVTGIVVNKKVQVPKSYRNKIRLEIYYITKFGLADHLLKTSNERANYIKHLEGKINYALYINQNDQELLKYKKFLSDNFSELE